MADFILMLHFKHINSKIEEDSFGHSHLQGKVRLTLWCIN